MAMEYLMHIFTQLMLDIFISEMQWFSEALVDQ